MGYGIIVTQHNKFAGPAPWGDTRNSGLAALRRGAGCPDEPRPGSAHWQIVAMNSGPNGKVGRPPPSAALMANDSFPVYTRSD
jgi:hypothetical protein